MEFQEIVDKFPQLKERVDRMMVKEKEAKMMVAVSEMPGTVELLKTLMGLVTDINVILTDKEQNKKMTEVERACLFERRESCQWLMDYFRGQHTVLARIDDFKKKYDKKWTTGCINR